MKNLLTFIIFFIGVKTYSQVNDEDAVMEVVNQVFEAMRTNDSTLLKSCFVERPNTFTVYKDKESNTQLSTGEFQRFVNAVGRPKDQVWNEPIWNEKVEIDGNLASVWVDYAFYADDQFSHCGADAFHLVKKDDQWKIFHLVDTRRKTDCIVPATAIPNNPAVTRLTSTNQMEMYGLTAQAINYKNREAFKVSSTEKNDEDGITMIKGLDFSNGIIEAEVIGIPKEGAPATARGFIGLAFRISKDETYECFYIRPTNSSAKNQIRRNHSVQYVSHPDYPWYRLREEEPKKYESYAEIALGEWTKLKIEVEGERAQLFINNSDKPSLIVNDLKLGERSGGVGFWTFSTTDAYFSNLKITKK